MATVTGPACADIADTTAGRPTLPDHAGACHAGESTTQRGDAGGIGAARLSSFDLSRLDWDPIGPAGHDAQDIADFVAGRTISAAEHRERLRIEGEASEAGHELTDEGPSFLDMG
jgi:hypothetical protein